MFLASCPTNSHTWSHILTLHSNIDKTGKGKKVIYRTGTISLGVGKILSHTLPLLSVFTMIPWWWQRGVKSNPNQRRTWCIGVKLAPLEEKRTLCVVSSKRLKRHRAVFAAGAFSFHKNILMTCEWPHCSPVKNRCTWNKWWPLLQGRRSLHTGWVCLLSVWNEDTTHRNVTHSVTALHRAATLQLRHILFLTRCSDCMTTMDSLPGESETVAPTQ